MHATEMHDLLRDCYIHITGSSETYKHGTGSFSHIKYCQHCGYADNYPHDEKCLIARLKRVTSTESSGSDNG